MLVPFGQKSFKYKKFYPKIVACKAHFTKRDKNLGKNHYEYIVSYPNQWNNSLVKANFDFSQNYFGQLCEVSF
ncbi:MAG TPA: hypothetical protein DHV88_06345 [Roseburia sp.]|mgnify:CR=1 FL=1|jgi:hypothetical protein|nr:hypothetical protein [Roseburia sp.]